MQLKGSSKMGSNNIFDKYWEMKNLGNQYSANYIEITSDWRALSGNILNKSPQGKLLKTKLRNIHSVLDIGCGKWPVKNALEGLGFKIEYEAVDLDPSVNAKYATLDSVSKTYDCIFMLEIIEHLDLESAIQYLSKALDSLNNHGILILSTPNIDHPNYFWRIDVTHVRPYPKNDLVGLLRQVGFKGEIEIYRQYFKYESSNILKKYIRKIMVPFSKLLYRIMELDHAQAILVFAKKL